MLRGHEGVPNISTMRAFRLSPPGSGRGVSCDANGAFIGAVSLLERSCLNGRDKWQPRECSLLSKQIGSDFGLPVDMSSKMGGLKAISNALNEGDVTRAQTAAVLLAIPEPPVLSKSTRSRGEVINFIRDLHWSGMLAWDDDSSSSATEPENSALRKGQSVLIKAGFNPDEPRDERGRWTDNGSGDAASGAADRHVRIQLADAGMSDASDDPIAEAAARAAARRNAATAPSQIKPVDREHEDLWQTLSSRLSQEAQSVLSEIGRAELTESNADVATAVAEANAIAGGLRAYANYRAQPWIGQDGVPVQVPVIVTDNPLALMGHQLFTPNAPLTRPTTNAYWTDPLLVSAGAAVAGPALELVGEGAVAAADSSSLAVDAPFITLPSKLPADFDATLPIGRYVIPTTATPGLPKYGDLVGEQIGRLVQDSVPEVKLILNTTPGINGPDIEVPEEAFSKVGFQYAEIKPLSKSGLYRFNNQVTNVWNLEGQVEAFTYDYKGNIYRGFSKLWQ